MELVLDDDLAQLYARALIAIARADGEISAEEGQLLQRAIDARSGHPLALDELLFETPLHPEDLEVLLQGDPFRGLSIHPVQLAEQLVTDALTVLLAKGHVATGEAHALLRFASALGLSYEDIRARIDLASRIPLLDKL